MGGAAGAATGRERPGDGGASRRRARCGNTSMSFSCRGRFMRGGGGLGSGGSTTSARSPDFIVSKGGTVYPVPKGASGPIPAESGKGFQFTGGSGGHGLSPKTTDVRIMDPVTSGKYQYPGGYGSY